MHYDVVSYSNANIDILIKVNKMPSYDDKLKGELIGRFPGGTMANYACAASKLGLKAAWTGSLGNDDTGQIIINDFLEYNVDVSTIIRNKQDTMFAVILIDDTGERSIVVVPTFSEPKELTIEQKKQISKAKIFYTGPYKEINFLSTAKWARNNDTLVMIDVELTSALSSVAEMQEACSASDIVIFNQSVLAELYDIDFKNTINYKSIIDLLRSITAKNNTILTGVTMGSKGSLVVNDKNESNYFPGFNLEVIDTTGAGDCFNAALTKGILENWDIEDLNIYANAAGALATQGLASRGSIPNHERIMQFIKNNKME